MRDKKNISIPPRPEIAATHMVVKPAAGPLTLNSDLLISGTTMPPIIPAISPEYKGAPLAKEIPRQSGSATKKTVILDLRSCFKKDKK